MIFQQVMSFRPVKTGYDNTFKQSTAFQFFYAIIEYHEYKTH